jgi:lipopolysaccharide/colanic/teichoic acid biosynthesis glycosyltransferase
MSNQAVNEYPGSDRQRALDVTVATALLGPAACVMAPLSVASGVSNRTLRVLETTGTIGEGGELLNVRRLKPLDETRRHRLLGKFGLNGDHIRGLNRLVQDGGADELLQLTDVILGGRSMVGRRHVVAGDIDEQAGVSDEDQRQAWPAHGNGESLFEAWQAEVLPTRPGFTGPGRLYTHRHHDAFIQGQTTDRILAVTMALELEYVRTANLGTDIAFLSQLPGAVMGILRQPSPNGHI